jgi:hypothetical protein
MGAAARGANSLSVARCLQTLMEESALLLLAFHLLGLRAGLATVEDVQRAFRREMLRVHPDKVHHAQGEAGLAQATQRAQQLNAARERLLKSSHLLKGGNSSTQRPSVFTPQQHEQARRNKEAEEERQRREQEAAVRLRMAEQERERERQQTENAWRERLATDRHRKRAEHRRVRAAVEREKKLGLSEHQHAKQAAHLKAWMDDLRRRTAPDTHVKNTPQQPTKAPEEAIDSDAVDRALLTRIASSSAPPLPAWTSSSKGNDSTGGGGNTPEERRLAFQARTAGGLR